MTKKMLFNTPGLNAARAICRAATKFFPPFSLTLLVGLLLAVPSFAQTAAQPVEMADAMRADGKIWVVAGVFGIISLGMLVYLFRLESKVTKLEKRMRNEG